MASARELMEKIDAFKNIQEAVNERIAAIKTPEEEREVNSLIKRAFNDECAFDKKHKIKLIALAIFPHEVSWKFKLRERVHRFIYH